jgi:hypothetical protein
MGGCNVREEEGMLVRADVEGLDKSGAEVVGLRSMRT